MNDKIKAITILENTIEHIISCNDINDYLTFSIHIGRVFIQRNCNNETQIISVFSRNASITSIEYYD